jgi:hypothetical protein
MVFYDCGLINEIAPPNWVEAVLAKTRLHGIETSLTGASSTSLTRKQTSVTVLDGAGVHQHLHWLYQLYATTLLRRAELATGIQLFVAQDVRSSVNVNLLEGIGAEYELHVQPDDWADIR